MRFSATLFILIFFILKSGICQSGKYVFNVQEGATRLLDSAETRNILISLDGFLKAKNGYIELNEYVDSAYRKINHSPFYWFLDIENNAELKDSSFYKPNLLAVVPVEKEQYLIKLSYIGNPPEGSSIHRMSYALIAKRSSIGYYFYNSVDYNTRDWNNKMVGSVTYIYPNRLNLKKAKEMDRFNKSFAKKLGQDILPLTYYRCYDPEQVFRIIGCDYIPNMYFSTSGGLAEQWHNTIYAGNNSELYPHEVVHFYTSKMFKGSTYNRIVDEGYATFIGGSGGKSLTELALQTKEYLSENPGMDLTKMFVDNFRFKSGVPIRYIAAGLICREIELNAGLPKVKSFFKGDSSLDNFFIQLEAVTGKKKGDFSAYVKDLINKSR